MDKAAIYVTTLRKIKATPLTCGEYHSYLGWDIPLGENKDAEGYLVEDVSGILPANHPEHAGQICWMSKEAFQSNHKILPGQDLPLHQQRVLIELEDLNEKFKNLVAFTTSNNFSKVVTEPAERARLHRQQTIMSDYIDVLSMRVGAF